MLGYARATPYERVVFQDFGAYLDTPLPHPTVFLERDEIVWRHLHASLLGNFFSRARGSTSAAGAMHAFGRMGAFCGLQDIPFWRRNQPKPPLDSVPNDHLHDLPDLAGQQQALGVHFLEFLEQLKDRKSEFQEPLIALARANKNVAEILKDDWPKACKKIFKEFDDTLRVWQQDYQQ